MSGFAWQQKNGIELELTGMSRTGVRNVRLGERGMGGYKGIGLTLEKWSRLSWRQHLQTVRSMRYGRQTVSRSIRGKICCGLDQIWYCVITWPL